MSAGSGDARIGRDREDARIGRARGAIVRLVWRAAGSAGGLLVWLVVCLVVGLAGGLGLAGCEAEGTAEQAQAAGKAVPAELRDGCKAVAERLVALTQDSLVQLPDRERALVDSQLGQVRDQYAARCMDEAWPAPVRDCMREAGTREAFAQCPPAPGR